LKKGITMATGREILESVISQLHDLEIRSDAQLDELKGFLTELDHAIYTINKVMGFE